MMNLNKQTGVISSPETKTKTTKIYQPFNPQCQNAHDC